MEVYVTKDGYAIYLFLGENLTATRSCFIARADFKNTLPEDIKSILIEINLREGQVASLCKLYPTPTPSNTRLYISCKIFCKTSPIFVEET